MKAKVVGIMSGGLYTDKQRRIMVKFADGDEPCFDRVSLPEKALGIVGLKLDDELEVRFEPVKK